jgi:hypothetical protein
VIDETDAFGGSVIDYVYRGGNVFLSFVSKAYKAGSITPFWPWATCSARCSRGRPARAGWRPPWPRPTC